MKTKLQLKLSKILKINKIIDVSGFKKFHNIYCDTIDRSYVDKGLIVLRDDLQILLEPEFKITHIRVDGNYDACNFQIKRIN